MIYRLDANVLNHWAISTTPAERRPSGFLKGARVSKAGFLACSPKTLPSVFLGLPIIPTARGPHRRHGGC